MAGRPSLGKIQGAGCTPSQLLMEADRRERSLGRGSDWNVPWRDQGLQGQNGGGTKERKGLLPQVGEKLNRGGCWLEWGRSLLPMSWVPPGKETAGKPWIRWAGVPTNRLVNGHVGVRLSVIQKGRCCHWTEEEMGSQDGYLARGQEAAQQGSEAVHLTAVSNQ